MTTTSYHNPKDFRLPEKFVILVDNDQEFLYQLLRILYINNTHTKEWVEETCALFVDSNKTSYLNKNQIEALPYTWEQEKRFTGKELVQHLLPELPINVDEKHLTNLIYVGIFPGGMPEHLLDHEKREYTGIKVEDEGYRNLFDLQGNCKYFHYFLKYPNRLILKHIAYRWGLRSHEQKPTPPKKPRFNDIFNIA